MKPEVSERLFIEELFSKSCAKLDISCEVTSVEKLTGDASTRRYYRVFTKGDSSYVVCLDNPAPLGENKFVNVQKFLKNKNVRVPNIYDSKEKRGFLLEEDLGNITLLQRLSHVESIDEEYKIYKKIVDELIKIHSIPKNEVESSAYFSESFDLEKFNFELNFTLKYFLTLFMNVEDDKNKNFIYEEFQKIHARLVEKEMVLTHRDFHSRNVMVKNEELIIIDFQDARWGIPQYDLVSLLEDCYYELDITVKEKLKKYYYDALGKIVKDQCSYEEYCSLYDDMAIQRVFKAIGSFSYIYDKRSDVRYLKNIGFAMEKLKRIMLKNSKYDNLRKSIFKFYYDS